MRYSQSVLNIAQEVSRRHPGKNIPFLQEAVYLLLGDGPRYYFFDLPTMLLQDTFDLIGDILAAKPNAGKILIFSQQLTALHTMAGQSNDDARAAGAALNLLNGPLKNRVIQAQALDHQPTAAVIWQLVQSNPELPFTLVTKNRGLACEANCARFFQNRPIQVLYPVKQGLKVNYAMPDLPSGPKAGAPAQPLGLSRELPRPPFTMNGQPLDLPALDKGDGLGGEGTVYLRDQWAYKLFFGSYPPGSQGAKKMEALCALGHKSSSADLCLPMDLIQTADGKICGFRMKRAAGQPLSAVLATPQSLGRVIRSRSDAAALAIHLTTAVLRLLYHGVMLTDLKPANIMVQNDLHVSILDLDSAQYDVYPGSTCSEDIIPPWQADKTGVACDESFRGMGDVSYALAVCLFMILVNGLHPTQVPGGAFLFSRPQVPDPDNALTPYMRVYSNLSYEIKALFKSCFTNQDPAQQPTPLALFQALLDLQSYLRCSSDQADELWPSRAKPAEQEKPCSRCGTSFPVNYLVHYKDFMLCEKCRNLPFHTDLCRDCGAYLGLTLNNVLLSLDTKKTLPLYCKACSAIRAVSGETIERPITQEERSQALDLIRRGPLASRPIRQLHPDPPVPSSHTACTAARLPGSPAGKSDSSPTFLQRLTSLFQK